MWPQKWNASAFCARRAPATRPPPLRASTSRPTRARNPRREVASATVSLSTDRPRRVLDQALELEERVEGSLREHHAVGVEDDAVRAAGNGERLPHARVGFLVEGLELDLWVARDEPQRGLQRPAQGAGRGGEDRQCDR